MPKQRILVIKLGALGDFIYSIGPMQAIKKKHPDAELTLMTRPTFEQGNWKLMVLGRPAYLSRAFFFCSRRIA